MSDFERAADILERLRAAGTDTLDTDVLVLRHVARQRGWSGPLRGALTYDASVARPFVEELQALLPDAEVALAPHKSLLKKVWASAMSGVTGMTRVRATPRVGPTVVVQLPDREDLVAEAAAIAIDTTFAIHGRFGEAAAYVDSISFDHAEHGMADGRVGGVARAIRGEVHINANYVVASTLKGTRTTQLAGTVAQTNTFNVSGGILAS